MHVGNFLSLNPLPSFITRNLPETCANSISFGGSSLSMPSDVACMRISISCTVMSLIDQTINPNSRIYEVSIKALSKLAPSSWSRRARRRWRRNAWNRRTIPPRCTCIQIYYITFITIHTREREREEDECQANVRIYTNVLTGNHLSLRPHTLVAEGLIP